MSKHVTWYANVGPNASHFGHTITHHDNRGDARRVIEAKPAGWSHAVIRGEDDGGWNARQTLKLTEWSDEATHEYAQQYVDKVNAHAR